MVFKRISSLKDLLDFGEKTSPSGDVTIKPKKKETVLDEDSCKTSDSTVSSSSNKDFPKKKIKKVKSDDKLQKSKRKKTDSRSTRSLEELMTLPKISTKSDHGVVVAAEKPKKVKSNDSKKLFARMDSATDLKKKKSRKTKQSPLSTTLSVTADDKYNDKDAASEQREKQLDLRNHKVGQDEVFIARWEMSPHDVRLSSPREDVPWRSALPAISKRRASMGSCLAAEPAREDTEKLSKDSSSSDSLASSFAAPDSLVLEDSASVGIYDKTVIHKLVDRGQQSIRESKISELLQLEKKRSDALDRKVVTLEEKIAVLQSENNRVNAKMREEKRHAERTILEKNKEINELSDAVDRILEAERKVDAPRGTSGVDIIRNRLEAELEVANGKLATTEKCLSDVRQENNRLNTEIECYRNNSKSLTMKALDVSLHSDTGKLKEQIYMKDETIKHLMGLLKNMKQSTTAIDGAASHKRVTESDRPERGRATTLQSPKRRASSQPRLSDDSPTGHCLIRRLSSRFLSDMIG